MISAKTTLGASLVIVLASFLAAAGEEKPTELGKLAAKMKPGEWKAEPCPEWLAKLMWFHAYDNNSCDPVNGLFFHRPSASRIFWQYDIGKKEWTKLPDMPGDAPAGHGMATISTYGVILHLSYQRVMVYKHAPAENRTP